MKNWYLCVALCAAASLIACGDDNDANTLSDTGSDAGTDTTMEDAGADALTDTSMDEIEIAGQYVDDFGGSHTIDSDEWLQAGEGFANAFAIQAYDNETDTAIAQNDSGNGFNPDLFSRFDWFIDGADIYICQTSFDAVSFDAAEATAPADATDLVEGCGGFSWTNLTPS